MSRSSMELAEPHKNKAVLVAPESLLEVLGVVYVHRKTSDGGDRTPHSRGIG